MVDKYLVYLEFKITIKVTVDTYYPSFSVSVDEILRFILSPFEENRFADL